jgi:hypothetical protein
MMVSEVEPIKISGYRVIKIPHHMFIRQFFVVFYTCFYV